MWMVVKQRFDTVTASSVVTIPRYERYAHAGSDPPAPVNEVGDDTLQSIRNNLAGIQVFCQKRCTQCAAPSSCS